MKSSQQNTTRLYLVAIVIALVALALGMWDIVIERESANWLVQLAMPLLLILIVGGLYMRVKVNRVAKAANGESDRGEA